MNTREQRRARAWWRSRWIAREGAPSLMCGFFVSFASGDWYWGVVAAWIFMVALSRIEDVIDKIND